MTETSIIGIVCPPNLKPPLGSIVREVESKRTPGNASAFISRAIAPASASHAAPINWKGLSVPRPSVAFVPSKNTVPG